MKLQLHFHHCTMLHSTTNDSNSESVITVTALKTLVGTERTVEDSCSERHIHGKSRMKKWERTRPPILTNIQRHVSSVAIIHPTARNCFVMKERTLSIPFLVIARRNEMSDKLSVCSHTL